MNMNDIILKKRDGGKLTQAEIQYFVKGYVAEEIPDYQASLPFSWQSIFRRWIKKKPSS